MAIDIACSVKKKRKHIWEINSNLFCSTFGTCLNMEEQREILKKLKMNPDLYTDYEIHGLMVQSLSSKNKLSTRLDNYLNKKYRYEISKYGEYDEESFMKVWREHMPSGDICGLYWVAVTHPKISYDTEHILFCEVHMLSHLNGGSARKERAECKRLSDLNTGLSAKLNEERKRRKQLTRELAVLEKSYRELNTKLRSLENKTKDKSSETEKTDKLVKQLQTENQELRAINCQLRNESHQYLELVRQHNKEKDSLLSDLTAQKEINIQLYREIENVLNQLSCSKASCGKKGKDFDLCERRVLIVGGLTKLRGFYRDLIEKMGGEFEYHDGYLQSGEKGLEDSIKRSDIILCPVDYNSHGACLSVKKICKKLDKNYQILPGSSLNSISQALAVVGEG